MASKRKTQFAILGLLSWKPMSGYDIKKLVDVGLSHFWNENYGQIYPALEQAVKEGFATKSSQRKNGKRKRFVYEITTLGQQTFEEWLNQPTEPPVVRNELQLKFFLSGNLPKQQSVRLIKQYQSAQQRMLEEYRQSEAILKQALADGSYPEELDEILEISGPTRQARAKQLNTFYLTLRHGIRAVEARLAWCEEVIENLQG